jgi:hypothetical protein
MRRAIALFVLVLVGAAFFTAAVRAKEQAVDRINGIGLIDYSSKPRFKVGDWVRYRMTGESEMGMSDDYEVTVLIAGEEEFWGDRGFWIETWTDKRGALPKTVATLMSYSIFDDTLPIQHMQVYQRKTITEADQEGNPLEIITKPAASMLTTRNLFKKPIMWNVDSLEQDTVSTPVGEFVARRVSIRQGTGATATIGDSSRYDEVRENRMVWVTPKVPITHVARESIESTIARRTWMLGRSAEGSPLLMRERGVGLARLVAMGSGLEPRLLPPGRRFETAAPAKKTTTAAKPAAASTKTTSTAKKSTAPAKK